MHGILHSQPPTCRLGLMKRSALQVASVIQGLTDFLDCIAREYEVLYACGVKQGLNLGEAFDEGMPLLA